MAAKKKAKKKATKKKAATKKAVKKKATKKKATTKKAVKQKAVKKKAAKKRATKKKATKKQVVEKKTKRRRVFYGCATYPKCDFTSWPRPLPQPCPQCGGLIVAAGGKKSESDAGQIQARCSQCKWRGAVGEPQLAEATA